MRIYIKKPHLRDHQLTVCRAKWARTAPVTLRAYTRQALLVGLRDVLDTIAAGVPTPPTDE